MCVEVISSQCLTLCSGNSLILGLLLLLQFFTTFFPVQCIVVTLNQHPPPFFGFYFYDLMSSFHVDSCLEHHQTDRHSFLSGGLWPWMKPKININKQVTKYEYVSGWRWALMSSWWVSWNEHHRVLWKYCGNPHVSSVLLIFLFLSSAKLSIYFYLFIYFKSSYFP